MRKAGGEAMWQAVLVFIGVVLGGAIAGGVTLRLVQLTTDREREARQAEQGMARKDARDVFQRDTVLAFQDAVADLLRMVVDLHDEAIQAEEKNGYWPVPRHLDELPASFDEHFASVQGLRARVFDEELRRLVAELNMSVLGAVQAGDRASAAHTITALKRIACSGDWHGRHLAPIELHRLGAVILEVRASARGWVRTRA